MTLLLGLGIIGSRCADQLIAADQPVATWNRTPKDRPDSISDLAQAASEAETILCYLRDESAVREVFGKIQSQLTEGKTFINHATIDPATTLWLAKNCREAGCGFLDAPFTGSRDAAAGGNLIYYVAGDQNLLEQKRSLLEITSREILYLGEPPAATVVKVTTNLATSAAVQALCEALEISRRHGVDPKLWHEAAKLNGCYSPVMGMKVPTLLEGDFSPHFSVENMEKDTAYAMNLGLEAGLQPALATCVNFQLLSIPSQHSHADFSAVISTLQEFDESPNDLAIIRVSGPDAERYLNGQLSNDVRLANEEPQSACLLNAKGQIEIFVSFMKSEEDFMVAGPLSHREELLARLDKYLIADDVTLTDETDDTYWPNSPLSEIERVDRGIPKWPNEIFAGLLPAEAQLDEFAVSFQKGCYVGQEVVSRMKRAGKTNRHLVTLSLDRPLIPTKSRLLANGKNAGWITSVATHELAGEIAIAYRLRKFSDEETFQVASPATGEIIATATIRHTGEFDYSF